ncbi:hypothetical protein [Streptomyces sp. NPDC050485]|uniref:hypothetical protein n=1 Tax=Streptomyces sp. NPDC050485 TaxID=3365617 RepID=UPI0037978C82
MNTVDSLGHERDPRIGRRVRDIASKGEGELTAAVREKVSGSEDEPRYSRLALHQGPVRRRVVHRPGEHRGTAMSARHRPEPEPVRLPGVGLLAMLLGIGFAGPAIVFRDRVADFCQVVRTPHQNAV